MRVYRRMLGFLDCDVRSWHEARAARFRISWVDAASPYPAVPVRILRQILLVIFGAEAIYRNGIAWLRRSCHTRPVKKFPQSKGTPFMAPPSALDPDLRAILKFLQKNPAVRARLCAPRNKTVVYSGRIETVEGVFAAWRLLAQAKAQDPLQYDYVTLEERLRQFHVAEFGETIFEHANRISEALKSKNLREQALILWRAFSGIYVQGSTGKVRALILPGTDPTAIRGSVFALTEVNVLLRADVLANIDIDAQTLRDFRATVRTGNTPAPIVVF